MTNLKKTPPVDNPSLMSWNLRGKHGPFRDYKPLTLLTLEWIGLEAYKFETFRLNRFRHGTEAMLC